MTEAAKNIAWKRELRRSLKREQVARERAALHAIRRRILQLRVERVDAQRALRLAARGTRQKIRTLAKARRTELRKSIAELVARLRTTRSDLRRLRGRVKLARELVRRLVARRTNAMREKYEASRAELERLKREHTEALQTLRELNGRLRVVRSTRAERRAESDDAVRANLPADLVEVFDAVKAQIKERPGRSRTEAFLEWVEAHPDDVWVIKQRRADRELRDLVRAQRHRGRRLIAAASDIPF
ncbi:MAG TPA: hypothetical protein VF420_13250 [Casimicrobiaceae bacterium]